MGMAETAVSFGKYPENTNAVDSDWLFKYKNKNIQHQQITDFEKCIKVADGGDWNNITDTGFYMGSNVANRPDGSFTWNYIKVMKHLDTYVLQEAINFNGETVAFRVKWAGTWKAWNYVAVQKKAVEFTTVNQTKTYSTTLPGPYGFGIAVVRSGNIVTATMDYVHSSNTNWNGKASETIPVGWRPVSQAIIHCIGEGGGGTGATLFNGSYVHLAYKPDGSISGRIKLSDSPLWFGASVSWVTTDPFPT